MNIYVVSHPDFLDSKSMPRFATMIAEGMRSFGHTVEVIKPFPFFYLLGFSTFMKKWLGYVDQFIIFPFFLIYKSITCESGTLFVFSDQALGMLVPFAIRRNTVIHCHDFLALRSSKGEFLKNKTSFTGRVYQSLIKRGFLFSNNFICVSEATAEDFIRLTGEGGKNLKVVYNGLNYPFFPMDRSVASKNIYSEVSDFPDGGYLLSVSGNQWYKNRFGVVKLYEKYCNKVSEPLPLVLVGSRPSPEIYELIDKLPKSAKVFVVVNPSNEFVHSAYCCASVFLFPSIAEGFGWPVAEAMACGCPVLTTGIKPMTEVGGNVACYLDHVEKFPNIDSWADDSAERIIKLLAEDEGSLIARKLAGFDYVKKFTTHNALISYEIFYKETNISFDS